MMINKRLINTVSESKKYVFLNLGFQWLSLIANIIMMFAVTAFLGALFTEKSPALLPCLLICAGCLCVRFICSLLSSKMSYLSSKAVKIRLREMIYRKLLRLGPSYKEKLQSSELVQLSVEGVEQLETYFGSYLPQFFYACLAPLTLFIVLSFVNFPSAIVLMVCVPLIPVSIALVQTWAKKLLSKYWDKYTGLGDSFLENLQGLTTLKIYKADEMKHREMNEEAENFRRITMRVLIMQLNSISIMDLVAYGGAALGIIMALSQMLKGNISLSSCLLIILLSADFFIPMRMLGSYFHIAMNGMAASEKMFRILDMPEPQDGSESLRGDTGVRAENLSFSYNDEREILHNLSFSFESGKLSAIVGESGCGKSTVAGILSGKNKNYKGSVRIGGIELRDIKEQSLMESFCCVSSSSRLFKGSVRDNLLLSRPDAQDDELISVLKKVKLWDFLSSQQGLNTELKENGSNFSGGQRQRLALARAVLFDSPAYIFDEASSNIDVESENDIMAQIYELKKDKTVILISHRLANVVQADKIFVMDKGEIRESGSHTELLASGGLYKKLWDAQRSLEQYVKEAE